MIFKVCLWKLQKLAFIAALDLVTQETLKGMIILLSYTVYNFCCTIGHSEKKLWKFKFVFLEEMFLWINWSYLSFFIELQNRRYERKRRTTANPLYNFEPEVIFSCCIVKNLSGKLILDGPLWHLAAINTCTGTLLIFIEKKATEFDVDFLCIKSNQWKEGTRYEEQDKT